MLTRRHSPTTVLAAESRGSTDVALSGIGTEPVRTALMIGPALNMGGGMASVERSLLDAADGKSWRLDHIASACNGSKSRKAVQGAIAAVKLIHRLIRNRPDVVHIHFAANSSFFRKAALSLLARSFNVPAILHCHAGAFGVFVHRLPRWARRAVRSLLDTAAAVVVLSPQWDRFFRDLGVSVPIHIVPNPVKLPTEMNNSDERIVLFLGRLGRPKGTYDLLDAVPSVLASCPDTRFILCGDGEGAECQALVDAKSLGNRVTIRSWIGTEERDELLRRCTVLVLPSYYEGLPLAVLEAMSYGVPVVTTTVGGIPDAVQDGVHGYLITPGDVNALAVKISELLLSKDSRVQMGRSARSCVESRFETSVVMRQLEEVYESVLPRAPTRA